MVSKRAVALSVVASCAGVVGSFLAVGNSPAFVVASTNGLLVDNTPGTVIASVIVVLGDLGHLLGFGGAALVSVLALAAVAALGVEVGYRLDAEYLVPGIVGVLGGLLVLIASRAPLSAAGTGIGMGVVTSVATLVGADDTTDRISLSRRWTLQLSGAVFGLGAAGYAFRTGVDRGDRLDLNDDEHAEIANLLDTAETRAFDIDGMPGLVGSIDGFYEVDLNSVDPDLDAEDWQLTIDGEVEDIQSFSYADIRDRDPSHRFITLRCVGDGLNGDKMNNALWTGIHIDDLLEQAQPQGAYAVLHAADGYYVEMSLEALATGFLAYGMNGKTLTRSHGFPVRVLIPGRWGETNIKWVSRIEIVTDPEPGYWEKRGWQGTGAVNAVAKLWSVEKFDDGRVRLAGHAYAGTRGIGRVEVSTDGGDTWRETTLSEPPPTVSGRAPDVWRQWTFEWQPDPGMYEVVVRSVDGEGNVQPRGMGRPYPNGATGRVSERIEI